MRLDLYLKTSRLVKRRTAAQAMCDEGRVLVNGREARPAKEVKPGDTITLAFSTRSVELEVLGIPVTSKEGLGRRAVPGDNGKKDGERRRLMEKKPLIAITMGDPAGIGPEIIAKVIDSGEMFALCRPVIVGDAGVMKKLIEEMRLSIAVHSISSPEEADPRVGRADVLDLKNVNIAKHAWGKPDISSGKAVVEFVKKAVDLAMKHEVDAIVTAPINKQMMNAAGHNYSGHTELFADLTKTKEFGMMFVGGGLRLILATTHLALKDVPRHIKKKNVLKTIRLAHKAMKFFGMDAPRIGVAALNPHAGEGRLFGTEEWDEILPAVIEARTEGINASDPLPADTLLYKARNNYYDIVVAMYHDQGLGPLKMLAFGNAVNVTVGLPIIRTSVDHGTAYDIAGKGCADPASLLAAIDLAAKMAKYRKTALEENK